MRKLRGLLALAVPVALVCAPLPSFATRGVTILVSQNSFQQPGDNESVDAVMTSDARWVAFESYANNFTDPQTDYTGNVFVRDTVNETTAIVSVSTEGTFGDDNSQNPSISTDGRFVAFESNARNFASEDPEDYNTDIYLRDRDADADGIFDESGEGEARTMKVSVTPAGRAPNGSSVEPAISADGKWVAFASWASDLVIGDSNSARDVFVAEVATGRIRRVSLNTAGQQAANQESIELAESAEPSLSSDGRYVAFRSGADNLVSIPAGQRDNRVADVFVRDRDTDADGAYDEPGAVRTFIVSVGPGRRQGTGASYSPHIALDGSFVVFASEASDLVYANDPAGVLPAEGELVPVDQNEYPDVYLRDIVREVTTLVSSTATGEAADGPSHSPSLSGDASVVAFYSEAPNLTPDPLQTSGNIYVRDLAGQHVELVSVASNGVAGNGQSFHPSISGDGIYVAFHSYASNFVPDQNGSADVFRHQRNVCSTGDPESGPLSKPVNDEIEPRAGPGSSTVHDLNCSALVPSGL